MLMRRLWLALFRDSCKSKGFGDDELTITDNDQVVDRLDDTFRPRREPAGYQIAIKLPLGFHVASREKHRVTIPFYSTSLQNQASSHIMIGRVCNKLSKVTNL
jgi:hypothetical protein